MNNPDPLKDLPFVPAPDGPLEHKINTPLPPLPAEVDAALRRNEAAALMLLAAVKRVVAAAKALLQGSDCEDGALAQDLADAIRALEKLGRL